MDHMHKFVHFYFWGPVLIIITTASILTNMFWQIIWPPNSFQVFLISFAVVFLYFQTTILAKQINRYGLQPKLHLNSKI